jgi:transcriptional regulator with XRE-family HTH domain
MTPWCVFHPAERESMEGDDRLTFGEYLKAKRLERHKTLCETARKIGVTPQYYSDVEKDRRTVLAADKLEAVAGFLFLDAGESGMLYDLAAAARRNRADIAVPQDFAGYIVDNGFVAEALRVARDSDAGEKEWQQFIQTLREKKKK